MTDKMVSTAKAFTQWSKRDQFPPFKGILSDSINIFLLHKSEDINIQESFPKFQLIPILCLQVMHDYVHWHSSIDYCVKQSRYVHWHSSIDYCVKQSLVDETLCKKRLSFYKEMISAQFLWGNVLLGRKLQIDATNLNFEIFESVLYMKSGCIPLTSFFHVIILLLKPDDGTDLQMVTKLKISCLQKNISCLQTKKKKNIYSNTQTITTIQLFQIISYNFSIYIYILFIAYKINKQNFHKKHNYSYH